MKRNVIGTQNIVILRLANLKTPCSLLKQNTIANYMVLDDMLQAIDHQHRVKDALVLIIAVFWGALSLSSVLYASPSLPPDDNPFSF